MITTVLIIFGAVAITISTYRQNQFLATPAQLVATALVIVALVGSAVLLGRRHRARAERAEWAKRAEWAERAGRVPPAWLLGLLSLVVTSVVLTTWYHARDVIPAWGYVALVAGCQLVAAPLVLIWSGLRAWTPWHLLALASGALLTYAWTGFVSSHLLTPTSAAVALISHLVFGLGAVALIMITALRLRRTTRSGAPLGRSVPVEA